MDSEEKIPCSIVIPVYNEEELIEDSVNQLLQGLESLNIDYEVILSENGSRDKTLEICKNIASGNNFVKVISYKKANYGRAMYHGITQASKDIIIILNIDYIDNEFINKSISLISDYDIIVGSRNMKGSKDKRPFLRRILTMGLNQILKYAFGYQGTETHWVKAMKKRAILPIIQKCQLEQGVFDTEFMIRAQRSGLSIKEIPVATEEIRAPRNILIQKIFRVIVDLIKLKIVLNRPDSLKHLNE